MLNKTLRRFKIQECGFVKLICMEKHLLIQEIIYVFLLIKRKLIYVFLLFSVELAMDAARAALDGGISVVSL